ncbi:sulfatase [Natronolimnohabitans innermongolicus]|uniref:Putative sulfatase n=1 Tax=Natronolimnohabitans innermongolicus JCM 12255 TaxID=1227499 RepID=L9XI93_9EURY|nr:sulfatase [Natronolimnohabitans innermongolicus]ELY61121.1 putative sulfatase [Natronolimnohabitans innermongolicus JCM 12255]
MSKPNIVLIVMDTARASTVLENRDVMPNLHQIADDGVTFTNAFTTGPWTLPSHASMFTGQYTSDHGTYADSRYFDPDVPTVAERVQEQGYQTVAFSNNMWVNPEFGFDRGFEDFITSWQLFEGGADLATIAKENRGTVSQALAVGKELFSRDGYKTFCNALYTQLFRKRYDDGAYLTNYRIKRWFKKQRDADRPFFLFANYLEPHLEYRPPRGYRSEFFDSDADYEFATSVNQDPWAYIAGNEEMDERDFEALKSLYRSELRYLDHRIGKLYDWLDERGELENTALFVVGDHGENIGEHGLMDHQYCLYDTLLHVPLIARYPETFDSGSNRTDLVEVKDLYATFMDLAGETVSEHSTNGSQSLIKETDREAAFAEYMVPQPSMTSLEERIDGLSESVRQYDRGLRAIRTKEWKFIKGTDGGNELYNICEDPNENQNIAAEHPEIHGELASQIKNQLGDCMLPSSSDSNTDADVEQGTKQRLEDLGYL